MENKILHHWMISLYSNHDGQMRQHYRTYATTKFLFSKEVFDKAISDIGMDNTSVLSVSYLGKGTFEEFNGVCNEQIS